MIIGRVLKGRQNGAEQREINMKEIIIVVIALLFLTPCLGYGDSYFCAKEDSVVMVYPGGPVLEEFKLGDVYLIKSDWYSYMEVYRISKINPVGVLHPSKGITIEAPSIEEAKGKCKLEIENMSQEEKVKVERERGKAKKEEEEREKAKKEDEERRIQRERIEQEEPLTGYAYVRKECDARRYEGKDYVPLKVGECLEVKRGDRVFRNGKFLGWLQSIHTQSIFNGTTRESHNPYVIIAGSCEEAKVLATKADKLEREEKGKKAYIEKVERERKERAKRERDAKISTFPIHIQELIKSKKMQLGMTKEQVIFSWGKPEQINRSVGSWGVHEQWVYGGTYLYFENDVLISWQDSTR
jgi:sRNA-binding protein